jgi:hypothetical protein
VKETSHNDGALGYQARLIELGKPLEAGKKVTKLIITTLPTESGIRDVAIYQKHPIFSSHPQTIHSFVPLGKGTAIVVLAKRVDGGQFAEAFKSEGGLRVQSLNGNRDLGKLFAKIGFVPTVPRESLLCADNPNWKDVLMEMVWAE